MRKKSGVIILSLCVILVIGLSVGLVLFINSKNNTTDTSTDVPTSITINAPTSSTEPISVAADINQDVILNLNGLSLQTESNTTAIDCQSAKSLKIVLSAGSQNVIDGAKCGIYAQCPVYIVGTNNSTLTIRNCETAINCVKTTTIQSARINIVDTNQGIVIDSAAEQLVIDDTTLNISTAKKCILIKSDSCSTTLRNADITLSSESGAIESKSSGTINILDCTQLKINCVGNAIDAQADIQISNTPMNIVTNKNAIKSNKNINIVGCKNSTITTHGEFTADNYGFFIYISNTTLLPTGYEFLEMYRNQYIKVPKSDISQYRFATIYSLEKSKAIKADENITIENSNINIASNDSAINADLNVSIDQSQLTIWTCNDAITCSDTLTINDTNPLRNKTSITVTKSFEGLEGHKLIINGGTNNITAFDDALICKANADTYTRRNQSGVFYEPEVQVNGGTTYVYSHRDDGIDSEGNFLILNNASVYMFAPFGMLTYNPLSRDIRYTDSEGQEQIVPFCGKMEVANSATFLYVCSPLSYNIPTLSSAQHTLIIDLKEHVDITDSTPFTKDTFVGIRRADGKTFTFKLPFDCITIPQYSSGSVHSMQRYAGLQIILSHQFITSGVEYELITSSTISTSISNPQVKTEPFTSYDVVVDIDPLDFSDDTTQIVSNIMNPAVLYPSNPDAKLTVIYGRSGPSAFIPYSYNSVEYQWMKFVRGIQMPNDETHALGEFIKQ